MNYKEIAKRLEKKVKAATMNQKEIAEKIQISEDSLTRYIKGTNQPKITILIELCKLINIDLNWLATGKKLNEEELNEEELKLLKYYQLADNRGKRRILQIAELEAGERKESTYQITDKENTAG